MSETAKMDGGRKPPQRQASAKGDDPVALKEVKSYISVTYPAFPMRVNFSS